MSDPKEELAILVRIYREQKEFADKINARVDALKQELIQKVQAEGFVDEKGNQWLSAGDFQLKRERRVSVSFNEFFAEEWARKKGVWGQVSETKEFVSEDKLLAVAWEDDDMKHDLDNFYTRRETFAFRLVEGKSYDED